MKFKEGDRVAVYRDGPRNRAFNYKQVCKVLDIQEVNYPDGVEYFLVVRSIEGGADFLAHPKQCRKIVPAKRRRIWIDRYAVDAATEGPGTGAVFNKLTIYRCGDRPPTEDLVEFVEVRRK